MTPAENLGSPEGRAGPRRHPGKRLREAPPEPTCRCPARGPEAAARHLQVLPRQVRVSLDLPGPPTEPAPGRAQGPSLTLE